jgi:hypothetical protein
VASELEVISCRDSVVGGGRERSPSPAVPAGARRRRRTGMGEGAADDTEVVSTVKQLVGAGFGEVTR